MYGLRIRDVAEGVYGLRIRDVAERMYGCADYGFGLLHTEFLIKMDKKKQAAILRAACLN
jgi:hypothetical protein